jgi:hypothetical protein
MNKYLALFALAAALACQACAQFKKTPAIGDQGKLNVQQCTPVMLPKCPIGWLSDTTNIDGDVTMNGKCKKIWERNITPALQALPNGTAVDKPIDGFKWNSDIFAWGTTDNGGAASQVSYTPTSCH